jgi:hypothetical protein
MKKIFVLVLITIFSVFVTSACTQKESEPTNSYVSVEINPSVEFVVDADGKVVYAVAKVTDGNGDPASTTYYAHPDYADYTKNPAIVITDTGYKIVVPQGGFAISGKGKALAGLLGLIMDPTIKDASDIVNLTFDKDSFKDNLRLSFDADKKIISTMFI